MGMNTNGNDVWMITRNPDPHRKGECKLIFSKVNKDKADLVRAQYSKQYTFVGQPDQTKEQVIAAADLHFASFAAPEASAA